MEAELFGSLADADSFGQGQCFVLIDQGMAGAGLFHRGCWSCHGLPRCSLSLNGVSTGTGQDQAMLTLFFSTKPQPGLGLRCF